MNTATKMLTFLIATGLGSTAMAASGQHTKVLPRYNHTPVVQLDVQANDVSGEEVQRFADVQEELSAIQQNFSARMDKAPNNATREQLQRQSSEQIVSTIEAAGFTSRRYASIASATESDPAMRANVQERTSAELPDDMMYGTRDLIVPSEAAPMSDRVRAEFSDKTLHRYVEVQDDLQQIRDDYADKIEMASDERDAKLLRKAKQEMADAIEDVGLNREQYANISLAMKSDPKLRDRVEEMMQQS